MGIVLAVWERVAKRGDRIAPETPPKWVRREASSNGFELSRPGEGGGKKACCSQQLRGLVFEEMAETAP
jgi:hypothetical protein